MNLTWRNPPAHYWYAAKNPGLSIQCMSSRAHQTALACFRSGHLRSVTFMQGVKSFFFTCPCSFLASPAHLLSAGAFPCDSCVKSKTWCVALLRGKVKWTGCRLFCSKRTGNSNNAGRLQLLMMRSLSTHSIINFIDITIF
ncbi:uncharacterized protein TNCV_4791301 [Trichonephila clavipes]|nr:uncharacterized protein TNCV_4791301 [Trichonephila clavipes]